MPLMMVPKEKSRKRRQNKKAINALRPSPLPSPVPHRSQKKKRKTGKESHSFVSFWSSVQNRCSEILKKRDSLAPFSFLSAVAERELSGLHDVALVRASGTRPLTAAVDGGAEEMHPGIDTARVDVVVLGEVAHFICVCVCVLCLRDKRVQV
jgi:hypothetical protein